MRSLSLGLVYSSVGKVGFSAVPNRAVDPPVLLSTIVWDGFRPEPSIRA